MAHRSSRPFLAPAVALAATTFLAATGAQAPPPTGLGTLAPGSRVWMHAHNCYPEAGKWADRLPRALGTGLPWMAIEQDVAWVPGGPGREGRSVVVHDTPPSGLEPTLEGHFFAHVRPRLDQALSGNRRDTWPVLVVSFDFKTNEPEHHRFVWDLLGRYERYLTTAVKGGAPGRPATLRPGPLLVLTESGPGQEASFFTRLPAGATMRIFGTVPPPELTDEQKSRRHLLAPEFLVPSGATDYRRWVNFSWSAVEAGGPNEGGAWAEADASRLRALVARAHGLGLWIRFYTLNGHGPGDGHGWSDSYNFGSLDAVRLRWAAAQAAGVEFIATDQYELFARTFTSSSR